MTWTTPHPGTPDDPPTSYTLTAGRFTLTVYYFDESWYLFSLGLFSQEWLMLDDEGDWAVQAGKAQAIAVDRLRTALSEALAVLDGAEAMTEAGQLLEALEGRR